MISYLLKMHFKQKRKARKYNKKCSLNKLWMENLYADKNYFGAGTPQSFRLLQSFLFNFMIFSALIRNFWYFSHFSIFFVFSLFCTTSYWTTFIIFLNSTILMSFRNIFQLLSKKFVAFFTKIQTHLFFILYELIKLIMHRFYR